MRKITLSILVSLLFATSFAQSSQLYDTNQGLISTRINEVYCDKDNFIWISSNLGLSRFDGQAFTNYRRQKDNPYALHENHVSCLYLDNDGEHWVGGGDGLYYMCRTHNQLTRYILDSIQPGIGVSQITNHPLRPHTLLVGTYGFGIFSFDTETRTIDRQHSWQLQTQLKRYNCQHILTDNNNNLWIASPTILQCINLNTNTAVKIHGEVPEDNSLFVQGMVEDKRHNRVYFATLHHGLLYCDLATMDIIKVDIPELNNRNLTCITLSPEGGLLVGTESEGLWMVRGNQATSFTRKDCPVDLNHVKIHSIAFDDQRNLWLGIFQKGLLFIPNQQRLFSCLPVITTGYSQNLGNVSSFAAMNDGSRLIGIDGEGVMQTWSDCSTRWLNKDNSIMKTNAVLSLASLPGNKAYIGTYNYGVYYYDGKEVKRDPRLDKLDKQSIMSMVHDSLTQTLYIGTNGDGIYAYNTNTGQLRRPSGEVHLLWIVSLSLDRRHRLWASTEGSIICFDEATKTRFTPLFDHQLRSYGCVEDFDGTIWFATDYGLLKYGPGSDSLRMAYAEGKPLNEEYFSLALSRDGRLWMPSSHGIVCYDPRHETMARYFDPEISAIGTFSFRAAAQWSSNGHLSFGGDNGVLAFSPEMVNAFHRPLKPIRFTRLWVNNTPTDYDPLLSKEENMLDESLWSATKLHLPASANSFSLSFAVQEYGNPLDIKYSYHMEGYEKSWHDVLGQDLSATYSSLPWGNYTLQVKATLAAGNGDTQTETKEMKIVIDAPWYASWWALLIYTTLFLSILYSIVHFYRLRAHQRHVVRRAEHNRQIKEAKLRMFTSVSHEIKTPLTLIISPLRRLMKRNNDNATQSVYEMMYRSTLRILMLVNQQMDIRKLDNGQLKLHVSEISLRSFLIDQMQYFSDTALARRIDFRLLIPEELEDTNVWFDPDQMDKVMMNLLSNAFKHVNEEGQVLIKVLHNNKTQCIDIEVFNSGSHMNIEDNSRIFERFSGDGSTGLGLNLANELTELHHGTLTVRNETDTDGVTFCVSLKQGDQHFTDEEKQPIAIAEPTEQDQLDLEAKALREEWHEPANDGKELIDMLNDELREKQMLRERRSRLSITYNKTLSSADERLLAKVSDCISKNLGDSDFNVDMLAQEVGISRVHLNRKLQELIDTSPSNLIKTTRIKQGAYLLVQNNGTIAEVAYTVGFSSPAYFSSAFTAYFKMNPKEFINTYLENPNSPELQKLLE